MRFDSPSESSGVRRPPAFAVCPASLRSRCGSASPGVLRPYDACAPGATLCHDRQGRSQETRAATPSSVPPTGFLSPPADQATTPRSSTSYPTPLETSLAPELDGLVSCRQRPWGSPYRAFPSRGAVPPPSGLLLPCGFSLDRDSGAKTAELSRSVSLAVPAPGRAHALASANATGRTGRELLRSLSRLSTDPASCPTRSATSTTLHCLRARRLTAALPASKLCSPRESVHAVTGRGPELAPESCPTTGPMLSWVLRRPLGACSTTTSGPVDREPHPADRVDPGRPRPFR